MPNLVNTDGLTWSEAEGNLSGSVTGRVPSLRVENDGTVGSVSFPGAVTIDAAGNVTFNQDVAFSGVVTGVSAADVGALPDSATAADVGALPDSATASDVGALPDTATAGDVGALPDSTTASDIGALPDTATASDVNAVALAGDTMTGDLSVPNLTVTGAIEAGSTRSDGVVVNAQTGTTYTLVASDAGKLVTLDNSSAITLTVPPNSSVAFEVGATIALAQLGAGTVSVSEGSGVTVSSLDDKVDLSGQYATASLVKTATDSWLLVGALA